MQLLRRKRNKICTLRTIRKICKETFKLLIFYVFLVSFILIPMQTHRIILKIPKSASSSVAIDWYETWGGDSEDYCLGMTVDSSNNIYLTGRTHSFGENGDLSLLKYNNLGQLYWNKTWGGSESDSGLDLVVDIAGNIYITGWTNSYSTVGNRDICLIKYDSSGILQWNTTWGNDIFDWGYAITMDILNNLYITGSTGDWATDRDIVLLKYDTSGVLQWNTTWGGSDREEGSGLAVDSFNNVYIVGSTSSYGSGGRDICLLKYNPSGVLQWNKTWGDIYSSSGNGIIIDSYNTIYIVGQTYNYSTGYSELCLLAYNTTGDLQWYKTWGGSLDTYGYDIVLDSLGDIYVVGDLGEWGNDNVDIVLLKYNNSASLEWVQIWGENNDELVSKVELISDDYIYISGNIDIKTGDTDTFLLRFGVDSDNDYLSDWSELYVYNTDPNKDDTDGDGLTDGEEILTFSTDPNKVDTDGDGVSDYDEIFVHNTDPNNFLSSPNTPVMIFWIIIIISTVIIIVISSILIKNKAKVKKVKNERRKLEIIKKKEKLMRIYNNIDSLIGEKGLEEASLVLKDILKEAKMNKIISVHGITKKKLNSIREIEKEQKILYSRINSNLKKATELKSQGLFEEAIFKVNETLKITKNLVKSLNREKIINELYENLNSIHKFWVRDKIKLGIKALDQKRFDESLKLFTKSLTIIQKVQNIPEKEQLLKETQNHIERLYVKSIEEEIRKGLDLRKRNLEESLAFFNKLVEYVENLNFAKFIYQKEKLLAKILDISDSIYSEDITEKISYGTQLVNQERCDDSLSYFKNVLNNIERFKFHNNNNKEQLMELINKANDKVYLILIEKGIKEGDLYRAQKNFSESISIFNKTLQTADKIYDNQQKELKTRELNQKINETYLTQIKDKLYNAQRLRKLQKYNESINLSHEAIDISKNMQSLSLREQVVKEINKFTDSTYIGKANEKINGGIDLRDQNKFLDSISSFKGALDILNKINDSIIKEEKVSELFKNLDLSYIEEINRKVKNGIGLRKQNHFEDSVKLISSGIALANNIHNKSSKEDELKKINENIRLTKIEKIKQTVLSFRYKYPRLQLVEIAEDIGENVDLIQSTIKQMISNSEIEARFYEITQSLVFSLEVPQKIAENTIEPIKIEKPPLFQYHKLIEKDPNLKDEILNELSKLIYGYHPLEVEKVYEILKEKFSVDFTEIEFTNLIEKNFDAYSIGIDAYKDPKNWVASRLIIPWYYIIYAINEEIKQIPEHGHERIPLKGLRDNLFFPEYPLERARKNLGKLVRIIEDCNKRGAFSRNLIVTKSSISVPPKENLIQLIKNMSNHLEKKFGEYWQDLSSEIKIQNIELYNMLSKELLDIKNSVEKPLIELIHAHKDKILPTIKEIHYIDKEDWDYFEDTYSSWKTFWKKLKKSLKFDRILVLVFQCQNCNRTYRFLYLQETKFSHVAKIILKIAPYVSEFLFRVPLKNKIPIKIEKQPEFDINLKTLLPDEISFLYQTLIGIEDEESKILAETFKFDDITLSLKCVKCIPLSSIKST